MSISRKLISATFFGLMLAACDGPEHRYLLQDAAPAKAYGTAAKLVLVDKIDLPAYFSGAEVMYQDEDGVLQTTKGDFWADSPDRAFTELVSDALDDRLSADVASSPWPFEMPADIKVNIKVRRFVAMNTGVVELKGQYFLSSEYGGTLARAARFEIVEPIAVEGTPGIASAYSRALEQLSNEIAKRISGVGRGEL